MAGLFPFPSRSRLGVFNKDSRPVEILPDLIGPGKVARAACLLTLLDSGFNFRITQSSSGRGRNGPLTPRAPLRVGLNKVQLSEFFVVVVRECAEDAVPDFEHFQVALGIPLLETTFVHGGVSVAHQVEYGGECPGRVQIVVQGLFEFLFRLPRAASKFGVFAWGEGFLLQTVLKIP